MNEYQRGMQMGLQLSMDLSMNLEKSMAMFVSAAEFKAYKQAIEDYRQEIKCLRDV